MTDTTQAATARPAGPPCAAATCSHALRDHELAAGQILCTPCVDAIRAWLYELPLQITVLEGSRQRETVGSQTGGRSSHATAPLPGRDDVLNLLGPAAWNDWVYDPYEETAEDHHGAVPIAGVLIPWVRLIAEQRRWNPPATLTPRALADWLATPRLLGWAARQLWAGAMRDELYGMMRTIRSTTRVRPQRRPVTQPCPRCDGLTLVETDHQLYIVCTSLTCERRFTRDELALAARIHPSVLAHNAA